MSAPPTSLDPDRCRGVDEPQRVVSASHGTGGKVGVSPQSSCDRVGLFGTSGDDPHVPCPIDGRQRHGDALRGWLGGIGYGYRTGERRVEARRCRGYVSQPWKEARDVPVGTHADILPAPRELSAPDSG